VETSSLHGIAAPPVDGVLTVAIMPGRPVLQHLAQSRRHARDPYWPRPDPETLLSLTLRIRSRDGAQARMEMERLLHGLPRLRIMMLSHAAGTTTLAIQAPREQLDTLLSAIMGGVPGAEFGPIQAAVLASVH
jgi:hypothetical protein